MSSWHSLPCSTSPANVNAPGEEGGQERQWHYKTRSHFPYSLALCLLLPVSGKGMEGRSPVSFFSDLQCCCFSGSWPLAVGHDKPKHYRPNSIQQISLGELPVKPSPSDLCQCQGQQCGQQCPAPLTTGTVPAGACSALQAASEARQF